MDTFSPVPRMLPFGSAHEYMTVLTSLRVTEKNMKINTVNFTSTNELILPN